MVERATPVISERHLIPQRPTMRTSAAASNRRPFSLRCENKASDLFLLRSDCRICNRASRPAQAKPATRRPCWVFRSTARNRSEGRSSFRNRLVCISVARMASLVAMKADRTLTDTPPKSTWLLAETVVFRSAHMFLPVLPSGAHRLEADLPNPLRSLDSLPIP